MTDIENNIYAPFVFDLFDKCMNGINKNMNEIATRGGITEQNIVEMTGYRAQVIVPMAFMLNAFQFPEGLDEIFGDNVPTLKTHLAFIQMETNEMANVMADMIGRPDAAGLDATKTPVTDDPFKGITLVSLDLAQKMIDLSMAEVEKEGEITSGAKLVRVHGANCALASTLFCVADVIGAHTMLASLGKDHRELAKTYKAANDFVAQTVEKIKAPRPC